MEWKDHALEDWENIVERVSELIVLDWDSRTVNERFTLMTDVSVKMRWLLENFPESPDPNVVATMKPWFRDQAVILIMDHMRSVQIYNNAPDAVLLENISETLIEHMANHLMVVAVALFRVVSVFDPVLADLINNIEYWDADKDLQKLLEAGDSE